MPPTAFTLSLVLLLALGVAARADEPKKDKPLDAEFLKDYAQTRGFMLGRQGYAAGPEVLSRWKAGRVCPRLRRLRL
jgi:hypothetical protein